MPESEIIIQGKTLEARYEVHGADPSSGFPTPGVADVTLHDPTSGERLKTLENCLSNVEWNRIVDRLHEEVCTQ